jgi:hypothetical protein
VLVLCEPAAGDPGMSRGGAPHKVIHRVHPVAGPQLAEDVVAVAFDDGAVFRGDGVTDPRSSGSGLTFHGKLPSSLSNAPRVTMP